MEREKHLLELRKVYLDQASVTGTETSLQVYWDQNRFNGLEKSLRKVLSVV